MNATAPSAANDSIFLPLCAIFRRFLKRQGLKFTPERAIILDAVLGKENVFEAEELHDEVRQAGHQVSKATIYRTLKHLLDAGIISDVLLDAKQTHYRLSFGREPKAYLVCVESNRIVEFSSPELLAIRQRICAEHGFTAHSHRFIIYGLSPEARASAGAEQ